MIKKKILGSQTIISDKLYVERSADVQLKQIIEDMGRPAYVLVARQMGKTNLLLHAKRTLASSQDVFAYLDASNPYPTLQEYFRNVVDTVLDSCANTSDTLRQDIEAKRVDFAGPPHREHERELLRILRFVPGKIVIIIDEVDALGTSGYSDSVFSYIRSIYFSARTNFPEFDRLTYVLSGVAEPTELIKNKAISPFNIGEKIYLDDFTKSEFVTFVKQAELQFSSSVVDRIFYWTAGNPRLCWDVCAAAEAAFLQTTHISESQIDELVSSIYFRNFDVPPVDHIRKLVGADPAIRDAITSIHWGKSGSIDSQVASKLYLSGIVKFAESKDLKIKNRIIAESVSEVWLRELEGKAVALHRMAISAYDSRKWSEAAALYEQYFNQLPEDAEVSQMRYYQAICKFNMEDFEGTVETLTKWPVERDVGDGMFYSAKYRLAVSLHQLGRYEQSLEAYKVVLEQTAKTSSQFYFEALVNSSAVYLSDFERHKDVILSTNLEILDNEKLILEIFGDLAPTKRIISAAHWNLSAAFARMNDPINAMRHIDEALANADDRSVVGLYLQKIHLLQNAEGRHQAAEACARRVIREKISLSSPSKLYPHSFTEQNCSDLLILLSAIHKPELFLEFMNYLSTDCPAFDGFSLGALLARAGARAMSGGNHEAAAELFRTSYLSDSSKASSDRRFTATLAILLTPGSDVGPLERKYVEEYLSSNDSMLISSDFRIAYGLVSSYIPTESSRARELLNIFRALVPNAIAKASGDSERLVFSLGDCFLEWLEIECDLEEHILVDPGNVKRLIERLVRLGGTPVPSYFPDDFGETRVGRLREILQQLGVVSEPFVRRVRKIGRNEKVIVRRNDGTEYVSKYKHVESLVASGAVTLVGHS